MMKIPILDLKRQYLSLEKEIDDAVKRVFSSGQFILGSEVEAFEKEIAEYIGVKHAIGVASGTDALLLALKALDINPKDRVVVPSFTFFATAGAVVNAGGVPLFCDIDPRTYTINVENLKKILKNTAHQNKIKAIIPVHLYGQPADIDEIMTIADQYGLYVIEDAAQAIGADYKGRRAGTIGHLGCFSFFPTKNLGAFGDGGLVVTNDDELAQKVRMLRAHGSKPKYYHHLVGTNSRLDALQAAILRVKLKYLPKWTEIRQQIAERYDNLLSGLNGIEIPFRAQNRNHIFHQYTIRVLNNKRDKLRDFLAGHGIATEIYYPWPLHIQPCFENLGYKTGEFPEAEKACQQVVSLPMFPELKVEEQEYIIQAVNEFFQKK